MSNASLIISSSKYHHVVLNVLNICVILALLRLTNFNYLLSIFLGLPTEINHTGGNAFNFTNYIIPLVLFVYLISRRDVIRTNWGALWPFGVLISIYLFNSLASPYVNISWMVYQMVFIGSAIVMHLVARKVSNYYSQRFEKGLFLFFWLCIAFVIFCTYQVLTEVSLAYAFSEYNDAFVHGLDDFGVMKQRFGYLLGFLVSYALFVLRHPFWKYSVIFILLFAGFGIRSYILGLTGAALIFSARRPFRFLVVSAIALFLSIVVLKSYFGNLLFDTRFYSYLNAFHIVQFFPFGVGLGGYPVYTEMFMNNLLAQFYNVNAVLDYIPTAPESDIVHIMASLGILLGSVHLLIQTRLVYYTFKMLHSFRSFEKCVLFYFCFMTFYGISEDSIFSINYWIFFGLSSGIVSSALYRKNKQGL